LFRNRKQQHISVCSVHLLNKYGNVFRHGRAA
jgi:hypothetical protein